MSGILTDATLPVEMSTTCRWPGVLSDDDTNGLVLITVLLVVVCDGFVAREGDVGARGWVDNSQIWKALHVCIPSEIVYKLYKKM